MIAKVVLNNREQNIDRTFDYSVPQNLEETIRIGSEVWVPFGHGNKSVDGVVVELSDKSEFNKLKKIIGVISDEPLFSEKTLELCKWVSKQYFCSLYQAIRLVSPPGRKSGVKEKSVRYAALNVDRMRAVEVKEELRSKGATAQCRALEALIMADSMPLSRLVRDRGASYDAIRSLEAKGFIVIWDESVIREVFDKNKYEKTTAYTPTEEQKLVIDKLYELLNEEKSEKVLLRGVTGSGKTEVFMQAIERVIKMGKNAIMLVPEISLTPQMVQRFVGRFGDSVAVIHSALSQGERFDQWNKIKRGEVRVVVGARSAIFSPMENIGIIILDEEHENSYKSETTPRYHALEVARRLAEQEKCLLLLASATPSVSDYFFAKSGEYLLLEMEKRYNMGAMPSVDIVDMRGELFQNKNKSPISLKLQAEIRRNLENKEKTILFLNRRGYSTFVSCRECGEVVNCPDCSVAMTYHKKKDILSCHYCGYTTKNMTECPACGSKYIKYFGTGTQRIEEELKNLFPDAGIIRMDTDTTSQKGGHEEVLDRFREDSSDILLGTQMVTKGLDFHQVSLVGVLAADTALALDDFRANERSFSLFTQVCGRAGRGDTPGRAVIQTYQPFNSIIKYARNHDYTAFYESEIKIRKRLNYPPFCDIIYIMITGEDKDAAESCAAKIGDDIKAFMRNNDSIFSIIGPDTAPIEKIRNNYRFRILLKCKDAESIHGLLSDIYQKYGKGSGNAYITIDKNPVNMF